MASRSIQILIVATHPADSFDMAGGTLSHHAAQGANHPDLAECRNRQQGAQARIPRPRTLVP